MIPVKICGITSLKDAEVAVNCGAMALGFIFYDKSPRNIPLKIARQIVVAMQGKVSLVGVFVDEALEHVHTIAEQVGLNFIQLHGNESIEYCRAVQFPVIKVFRVSSTFDSKIINNYDVHAFLFDTYEKDKPGGTGDAFNWEIISDLSTVTPVILSGGLRAQNIEDGINTISPSAVDINSGVESVPGIKDKDKMNTLFNILKNTENTTNPFIIPAFQDRQS